MMLKEPKAMKKEAYKPAELTITLFDREDVLTTSGMPDLDPYEPDIG